MGSREEAASRGTSPRRVSEHKDGSLDKLISGVRFNYHTLAGGAPVLCVGKICGDELRLERAGRSWCRDRVVFSCRVDLLRSVVVGQETTTFRRTEKYTNSDRLIDSYLNSFSLLYGDVGGLESIDLEVLEVEGGTKLRDDLVRGFECVYRLEVLPGAPDYLDASLSGFVYCTYCVVRHVAFSAFIYSCIIASVVVMALSSPLLNVDKDLAEKYSFEIELMDGFEAFFTWVFTVEVVFRVVAFESFVFYISDPWNALDFSVVFFGWLTTLVTPDPGAEGGMNFSSLRALRALRVLRTFKVLGGIKEIVDTFIKTLSTMAQGIALYFYFLGLFTVCAIELWGASLQYNCVNMDLVAIKPTVFCISETDALSCPENTMCRRIRTGGSGFESFSVALTTLYSISLRAGLGVYITSLSANAQDVYRKVAVVIFFLFFNLFVSCMLFSFFIAIIRSSFASIQHENKQRKIQLQEKQALVKGKRWDARVAPKPVSRGTLKPTAVPPLPPKRNILSHVIETTWFDNLVTTVIVVNCVFFSLEYHGQPLEWEQMLATSEKVFAILFTVEMAIKVIGLGGFRGYFKSHWNRFDFILVVTSLIDAFGSGFIKLSILRLLRLLRIIRVLRQIPDIVRIINALIKSLPALGNLILFCVLLLGVFAILGMQLYGTKMGAPEVVPENATWVSVYRPPRAHFDTFPTAMLTLFQMMTGGAQWPIYYNALETDVSATVPFFFLIFGIFSSYIVLNFMVVIIMSNFTLSEEDKEALRKEKEENILKALKHKQAKEALRKKGIVEIKPEGSPVVETAAAENSWIPAGRREYSMLLIPPTNPIRVAMMRIATQSWFESTVIVAIIGSSIALTLDAPHLIKDKTVEESLFVADIVFLAIFTAEFVLKVVGFGFILPQNAYLRDPWNRLDIFVLGVSWFGFFGQGGGFGRVLRIGRILRPLRMINRNEGLKVIVDALIRAIKPVSYTVILLLCYFFVFGMLGMEFFLGSFWYCNDGSILEKANCTGHYVDGDALLKPRVWTSPEFGYDSIGEAFCTLLETIALKGWSEKLYVAMDVTKVDHQPIRENSPYNALFYVVFIYFGSFFMMKLFVGVIVGTFRSFSGTLLLTPSQLQWIEMKRVMSNMQPHFKPPNGTLRLLCYRIWTHPNFDSLIVSLTLAHILLVGLGQSGPGGAGKVVNTVFTIAHWAAFLIRLLAKGAFRFFFKPKYDQAQLTSSMRPDWSVSYEFVTLILLVLTLVWEGGNTNLVALARALDFTQIIKLVNKSFPKVKQIITVLSECMLSMANVTLVFFMVLFIYAILGMNFFGTVKHGNVLGPYANFETFPKALQTIFSIAAGDNWIIIMREASIQPPMCFEQDDVTDCGSLAGAKLYFYSFYFVCFGVFLNLYTATVVDAYASKSRAKTFRWTFTQKDFAHFQETWKQFDTQATGRISITLFENFFKQLGAPFGNDKVLSQKQKTHQYNYARIELFSTLKTNRKCALPNGKVTENNTDEPSTGFFDVLQVLVIINVNMESLSLTEKIERERQHRAITQTLAAKTIQSFFRTTMCKRVFAAMVYASENKIIDTANLQDPTTKKIIKNAYKTLYHLTLHNATLQLFQTNRNNEISFDNIKIIASSKKRRFSFI